MSQKANSRKKILIAAVLAGVLIIGAIVSIVLVLAASTQNITSNITISYNVEGVGARVSARYGTVPKSGDVAMASMTTTDGTTSELVFNVSDTKGTQTLTPNGNIALSQTTGLEVVFEYRFQNIAESGFTVGLTITGEEENNYNINETFYVSGSQLETSEYGRITESSLAKQAMLNYDDILYIYVKVSVANENLSAAYNKAYNWELKQITSEEVIVTLNDNGGTNGLTSVNAVTGAATPILETLPTAPEGQGFIGYYDATSGGTQYISKSGVGLKEITGAITLYAQYSEEAVLDITGNVLYGINPTSTTTTMTELNVPTSVTEIGDSAFENNTSITSVTFEDTATASYASGSLLRKIGAKAFKGCTGLTELVIPEGVTEIKGGALQNLTNLTKLVLPSTVTSLPGSGSAETNSPLTGCSNLIFLEISANAIPFGGNSSDAYGSIDCLYGSFEYEMLTSGTYAPNTIKEVVVNSGTILKTGAFYTETNIEKITLADTITEIGFWSLAMTGISEIKLPSSLEKIQSCAFWGDDKLTHIEIPITISYIYEDAFEGCSLNYYNEYDNALYLGNSENPYVVLMKVKDANISSCKIHEDTRIIWKEAFYNCNNLTCVTFTENNHLTSIGSCAFYNCKNLTSIEIPSSVTSIGAMAFNSCSSLTKVNITNLESWFNIVFDDAASNPLYCAKNLYLNDVLVTSIEIPSSITKIRSYSFYNCTSITSIEISANVTSIGSKVFYGCENLTNVTFANSTGWAAYSSTPSTKKYNVTVTTPSTNAINLRDTSYSSSSTTNWGYYTLKRTA